MLRDDDDDDDDDDDAREARYLRRRTTALERALRESRARGATLEAEILEGRSAWTRDAKRELERALEATGTRAESTREVKRFERDRSKGWRRSWRARSASRRDCEGRTRC